MCWLVFPVDLRVVAACQPDKRNRKGWVQQGNTTGDLTQGTLPLPPWNGRVPWKEACSPDLPHPLSKETPPPSHLRAKETLLEAAHRKPTPERRTADLFFLALTVHVSFTHFPSPLFHPFSPPSDRLSFVALDMMLGTP